MRTIFTVVGALTVAQWIFIGLVHLFLTVQDKRSPETLAKLHDVPVIGGYFPDVKLESDDDKEQKYADRMTLRLIESKKYYDLPKSFDEAEINELVADIKSRKEDLARAMSLAEERQIQIASMVEDLERREKKIIDDRAQLDDLAVNLEKTEDDVALREKALGNKSSAAEEANLKKIAKWLNNLAAEKAANFLLEGTEGESMEEQDERFVNAAKVLSLMDEEAAAKVIETMDPVDWVRIEEKKKLLPPAKKK